MYIYIHNICIARHMTAHVLRHVMDCLSGGASAPVRPLIFANMFPRKRDVHRRRADGNGNDAAASSMPRGHAARRCVRLDTETVGLREARLEVNVAELCKATGLGDGRAAAVQP